MCDAVVSVSVLTHVVSVEMIQSRRAEQASGDVENNGRDEILLSGLELKNEQETIEWKQAGMVQQVSHVLQYPQFKNSQYKCKKHSTSSKI